MTDHEAVVLLELGSVAFGLFLIMVVCIVRQEKRNPTFHFYLSDEVKATIHSREQISVRYSLKVSYPSKTYTEENIKDASRKALNQRIAHWALSYDREHVLSDAAHWRLKKDLDCALLDYVCARDITVSIAPVGNWPKPIPPPVQVQLHHAAQPQTYGLIDQVDYERFTAKRIAAIKHQLLDPTDLD